MKHFFAAVSLALFSSISAAQVVTYESVRLADMLIEGTWQTMEQSFPAMITGLESDLRSGGATERASKVLAEETRRTLTRDNFTRFIAQALSEKLNEGGTTRNWCVLEFGCWAEVASNEQRHLGQLEVPSSNGQAGMRRSQSTAQRLGPRKP